MSEDRKQASGNAIPTPEELGFDPAETRQRYAAERTKRIRADGNDQYLEVAGEFERYSEVDPYVEPGFTLPSIHEELDVVVVGGGFGGLMMAARLHQAGITNLRILEQAGANVVVADLNNAGIGGAVGPLEDVSVEDWDRTQAVCLRGVFLGMKHAAAPMRAAGGGSIISTSSIGGLEGSAGMFSYCAAKAGVVHLTRCAALEFARDRIRVNCIAPGGISTPILFGIAGDNKQEVDSVLTNFQACPHVGQPEDIANSALFLSSDAAAFMTGQTLVVDGGLTAGPQASAPKPGRNRKSRFAGPSFD